MKPDKNIKNEAKSEPHYYIEPLRIVSDKVIEMGEGRISKEYINKVIEYENQYAMRDCMYLHKNYYIHLDRSNCQNITTKVFNETLYEDCACYVRSQLEDELKLSHYELFYNILDYVAKSYDVRGMRDILAIHRMNLNDQRLRIKYNDFSADTKVADLEKREAGEKRPIVGMSDDWIRHFEHCPSGWCLMWHNFQKNWMWVLPCLLLCTVANKGLQSAIALLLFMGIGTYYQYHVEVFLGCVVKWCLRAGTNSWFEKTQYEKEQEKIKDQNIKLGKNHNTSKTTFSKYYVKIGKTCKLYLGREFKNVKKSNITYKSANNSIASVTSHGVVKGLKKGTTRIIVQYGDKKNIYIVRVGEK